MGKEEYIQAITEIINKCDSLRILDYVLKILQKCV